MGSRVRLSPGLNHVVQVDLTADNYCEQRVVQQKSVGSRDTTIEADNQVCEQSGGREGKGVSLWRVRGELNRSGSQFWGTVCGLSTRIVM